MKKTIELLLCCTPAIIVGVSFQFFMTFIDISAIYYSLGTMWLISLMFLFFIICTDELCLDTLLYSLSVGTSATIIFIFQILLLC